MNWNLTNTSLFNESFEKDNVQMDIPVLVSVSVIGFLSLTLNGGVFILVIKTTEIRSNPYHFLVMMLSVSDFFVGLSNVFIFPRILNLSSMHTSRVLVVAQTFMLTNGLYLYYKSSSSVYKDLPWFVLNSGTDTFFVETGNTLFAS